MAFMLSVAFKKNVSRVLLFSWPQFFLIIFALKFSVSD